MNYSQLVTAITDYTENTFSVTDMNTFIEQAEQRIFNTIQFPSLRKNQTGTITSSSPYLSAPSDFLSTYSIATIDSTGTYAYLINKDVNFMREAYPSPAATGTPKYYAIFGPQSAAPNELSFILGPTPDTTYGVELHYFFYPESIVQGIITATNTLVGGSSYANGTYYNVPLTGGSGSGATATIKVAGAAVTSVTITSGGCQYVVGDVLTAANTYLGGSGSGFSTTIASVANASGTTWLGDNYDAALFYGALVEAYTFMKGEVDIVALVDKKYTEALMQAKRLGDGLERQDAYRSGQFREKVT
jgi:hypothetical protein